MDTDEDTTDAAEPTVIKYKMEIDDTEIHEKIHELKRLREDIKRAVHGTDPEPRVSSWGIHFIMGKGTVTTVEVDGSMRVDPLPEDPSTPWWVPAAIVGAFLAGLVLGAVIQTW